MPETTTTELPLGLSEKTFKMCRALAFLRMDLDQKTAGIAKVTSPQGIESLGLFTSIYVGLRDAVMLEPDAQAARHHFAPAFEFVEDLGLATKDTSDLRNGSLVATMRFEMILETARVPLWEEMYELRDPSKEGAMLVVNRMRKALLSKQAQGTLARSLLVTHPPHVNKALTVHEGGRDS